MKKNSKRNLFIIILLIFFVFGCSKKEVAQLNDFNYTSRLFIDYLAKMSEKHKIFNFDKEIRIATTKDLVFTNKYVVPYLFMETLEQTNDYFINADRDAINEIAQETTKNIVLRRALYLESLKNSITVSDTEIAEILDEVSEGEADYFERKFGVNKSFFINEAKISLYNKKYQDLLALKAGIDVQDSEIENFYNNNPTLSYVKPRVIAKQIFFSTEDLSEYQIQKKYEKAETVLNKLNEGEDFAKLALIYSEEEGTKYIGGIISEYIEKGMLVKELDGSIFNMKEGELSPIIKTVFGYHIVKIDKIMEERRKSIDELRVEIVYMLKIKKEKECLIKYNEKTLKMQKLKISKIIKS